jgi:septum formation protein
MPDLVLASASPRRADLLEAAGIDFTVAPVDVDESIVTGEPPEAYVRRVALAKVRDGIRRNSGKLILAADTAVVIDAHILGKPDSPDDARSMLKLLAGRVHEVLTGVALADGQREVIEVERTRVRFLMLSDAEIEWYVASGEPDGKAGAYAIQGRASRFIDWIEGSYTNVVGLPVATVHRLLAAIASPAGDPRRHVPHTRGAGIDPM